jgi:sugar/nucleoside kinase (ribokinase family)
VNATEPYDIVSLGPLLVEIIRTELDKPLCDPAYFSGPYASGDTPIFIDAAARLGKKCCFIGIVGNDDFGRCVVNKLELDGVDIAHIRVVDHKTTAVTFVAYFSDGSRKFLYHVPDAAAGLLSPEDVNPEHLENIKWLHVTGFSLSGSKGCEKAIYKAMECISGDARVSFDPNIRPEILSVDEIRKLCQPAIERADLILPSISEAAMLTGAENDDKGCRVLQKMGKLVVQKNGLKGCLIYSNDGVLEVPTFQVEEIDPTGAGDAFSAAFIIGLIEEKSLYETGLFANAVGALSVRKVGPMEGLPTREEVYTFLKENGIEIPNSNLHENR